MIPEIPVSWPQLWGASITGTSVAETLLAALRVLTGSAWLPHILLAMLALMMMLSTLAIVSLQAQRSRSAPRDAQELRTRHLEPPLARGPPCSGQPSQPQPGFQDRLIGRRIRPAEGPLAVVAGAGVAVLHRIIPGLQPASDQFVSTTALERQGHARLLTAADGAVLCGAEELLRETAPEGDLTADRARWPALIAALVRHRGDRPMDAIVLVMPVSRFLAAEPVSEEALTALGHHLHGRLREAERIGGWRVPVYVVLTEADLLQGFAAFAQGLAGLAPHLLRTPFGWSVPYGPDILFEPAWLSEATQDLAAMVSALQAPLLMRSTDPDSAEGLLLFSESLTELCTRLAVTLAAMLRPSAYRQAFLFRGFYLVGRIGSQTPDEADCFAPRLFADRVFPEQRLARPAHGAWTRRLRRLRAAQALFALLAILAPIGLYAVRNHVAATASLLPLIEQMASFSHRLAAAEVARRAPGGAGTRSAVNSPFTEDDVQAYVEKIAALQVQTVATPFAPLSFLSDADTTIVRAVTATQETVVLRAMSDSLTTNLPRLLGALTLPAYQAQGVSEQLICKPKAAVTGDIAQLQILDRNLAAYARFNKDFYNISTNTDSKTAAALLKYTLDVEVPQKYFGSSSIRATALSRAVAPPVDMSAVRQTVSRLVQSGFVLALNQAFPDSVLARAVHDAAASSGLKAEGAAAEGEIGRLQHLAAALHLLQAELGRPDHAWLAGDRPQPALNAELNALSALGESGAFGDLAPIGRDLVPRLRRMADDCAAQTRGQAQAARALGTLPVIVAGSDAAALNPALVAVIAPLDRFLQQPLAAIKPDAATHPAAAPTAPLFWDSRDLALLAQVTDAYLAFEAAELPLTLPVPFRLQVQSAAGGRLIDLLSLAQTRAAAQHAQRGDAAGQMREEIARFAEAAPILGRIAAALRRMGLATPAAGVEHLLDGQAARLLSQVDRLLLAADPYQLADRSLSFWNGSPPLAAAAFGAPSLADLVGTLPARRDYIDVLAQEHARPLLSYLTPRAGVASADIVAMLKRWSGIIDTLDRYRHGDPGNSLARLEQLIAGELDRVDAASCAQFGVIGVVGTDWFAQQAAMIRSAVVTRCAGALQGTALQRYADLAASFNATLAGRFPFGALTSEDADPLDIRRFFDAAGSDLGQLRQRLINTPGAPAGAAVFVGQLIDARAALEPLLNEASPDPKLSYQVTIDFRANAGAGLGGNQVAEAMVSIGPQTVSGFSATPILGWTSGQGVSVQLRWARNAPTIPASGSDTSGPLVRGLTASFDERGAWALLRLLTGHRPDSATLAQLADRRAGVLGFVVPLRHNPEAAPGGETDLTSAQVFLRLGLVALMSTPGGTERRAAVALPIFPSVAPRPTRVGLP